MLSAITEIKVRFNEVDPLGITWHGHYITYFELGREAFGEKFNLSYMEIYRQGYVAPIVNINCDYKRSLKYGDKAIVETTFIDHPAAKIVFNYKIYLPLTKEIIATGSSIQVFLDGANRQLQIVRPDFFENWRTQHQLFN